MYNNEYGRNLQKRIKENTERYLNHLKEENMFPHFDEFYIPPKKPAETMGLSIHDSGYDPMLGATVDASKKEGGNVVETAKKYGKRAVRVAKALKNVFIDNKKSLKDLANITSLGKYGEVYGDGKKKAKGRPKKQQMEGNGFLSDALSTIGLGKKGRPKKQQMEGNGFLSDALSTIGLGKKGRPKKQKVVEEVVEVKKGRGRPRKEGKGFFSNILSSVGLGKQSKKDIEDEKLGEEMSQLKKKVKKIGKGALQTPQEKLDLIVQEGGVKQYNKKLKGGAGVSNRKIGGRKLLLKEEMPPSMMSGGKKESWQECIKRVKKENPDLKGLKQIIEVAKKQYKK